jgi:hypothetical protein
VIWLGWRQQRTETLIAAVLLALVGAILIPVGIEMAHAYTRDGLSHCIGASTQGPACGVVVASFEDRFSKYVNLVGWFNLVPGLFGVALAAPFALELERGTHRLAWTQSITRRRWVTIKLGLAVGSTLLVAALLTALEIWWRRPLVHIEGRMENGAFDSNIVILGYALFALGLALAIGVVWRRAIPAVMVSFVAYFVARIFTDTWLRQRLVSPVAKTWPVGADEPSVLNRAWVISQYPSNAAGQKIRPLPTACFGGTHTKCVVKPGFGYMHAVYEPASSFWSLQLIELALFGGIAVALIAFAGWWTLRRE